MPVLAVTGFVPIPGHPRSAADYERLGERFAQVSAAPVKMIRSTVEDCWLYSLASERGARHREGDNPQKNTLAYHAVQHQKTEWLLQASRAQPEYDVLVWIDYGIFHVAGITPDLINGYLAIAAGERGLAIPGCWDEKLATSLSPDENYPFWRFCGGAFACHRDHIAAFDSAVKDAAAERLTRTGLVTWEVNDWRKVEEKKILPIRWYHADHNQTMFSNYRGNS